MAKRVGKWLGGYVRQTKEGKRVFIIEKWGRGSRWHVSTGCNTERAALKELERFEDNPAAYRPAQHDALRSVMDAELILGYRKFQLAKGLSPEWVDEVARCLADWMVALNGRDLRTLDLFHDVKPCLELWDTRLPHRIKALKGFFRWLRSEKGLVSRQQDPTLDLRVPVARPEQQTRDKVVPPEDVQAVLKCLKQPTRDVLLLLTATAWHLSEVRRFSEAGEILDPIGQGSEGVLAVLLVRHKNGDLVRNSLIYEEHKAAAERLRARGGLPKRMTLARHMIAACDEAGVPWFGLGQMRHTVLTWAKQAGASLAELSEAAHHRSEQTTRRFYVNEKVPRAIPTVRLVKLP